MDGWMDCQINEYITSWMDTSQTEVHVARFKTTLNVYERMYTPRSNRHRQTDREREREKEKERERENTLI